MTLPYSEAQWDAIDTLGRAVDADLATGDVRLTMGGEPTFVSIDDMEGEEWTIAALGPTKRRRAAQLLRRLQARFAAGGVLHFGQGKWYPGEPLPRWALSCIWRRDGVPLWRDRALLADEDQASGYDIEHAARFIGALADRLGVSRERVLPGYEDVFYYMWKEGTLPANVDPLQSNLDDPEERRRLAGLLRRGLGAVTGYALPLLWQGDADVSPWVSSAWTFRRKHMYLVPGSSAMGYRLPLDSLPWVDEALRDLKADRCQFDERPPLGDAHAQVERRYQQWIAQAPAADANTAAPRPMAAMIARPAARDDIARTALCVEPRDGTMYVFLPPLTHLEHYVELLAAVEATAADLGVPVVLEGYEPPRDWRLRRFSITPDPGVIEVNIFPADSWEELEQTTSVLYEEARQCRLGTEKFMLDGRHSGTGGGNHITFGAAMPGDSPVLRRPDLLRSLVTYWQHHPSLSYLFSGMFVGPTSQAPRVDEARHESLYELKIAFQQIPAGDVAQPWLVDRLLRNLLIDVTGNTHRAEFCIDKLYSPDGPAGRLGLVEVRAFEMPPHHRMSLVQMLLLRALIARFWHAPYQGGLVRWRTALHDRFVLPHFVWQDFADVICDLQHAGYAFEREWFAPFFEFRFPHYGTVDLDGVAVELRFAIEPWHVLGEEVALGGTARYVDSSVERLQVKVDGMTDPRHVLTCNGRRVPLHATGRVGEYVAGVRYRAWQPPSALHPTIPVQAPLVFDLVDRWSGRSVGGCTYHVTHPGGRSYDDFPVNANSAEARRIARFWSYGHTPGPMAPPHEERSREFPYTLDLRRADQC